MSAVKGRVGSFELEWVSPPHGAEGEGQVRLAGGELLAVRWRKDADGIWIELPSGVHGFDVSAEALDEGGLAYRMRKRGGDDHFAGVSFLRAGAGGAQAGASGKKKGLRIRAQMPGKIVRVLVKEGAEVERNQPVLVMEAMKMENEIRAAQPGRVTAVKVSEGQAVETGADLLILE
jgi:acetyl/propionyl-CoA carboxylase alpha subunit